MKFNTLPGLFLLFFIIFCNNAFTQELSNYSVEELKTMKQQAVADEDFELAANIKNEIENRKSIDEIQAEFEEQLNAAVENQEFEKAAEIKKKIELCEEYKRQDSLMNVAVENEEYEKAQQLKVKKENGLKVIKMPLESETLDEPKTSEQTNSDIKVNNQKTKRLDKDKDEVSLVIMLNPVKKNIFKLFDLYVDEKYVGSIDESNQLIISNLEKGTHQIGFSLLKNVDIEVKKNSVIEILGCIKTKKIEKNKVKLDENTTIIKVNKKLSIAYNLHPFSTDKNNIRNNYKEFTQEQNFKKIQFPPHDSPFEAKYNTSTVSTDIPSYFSTIFNYGIILRTPLNRDLGLVAGLGIRNTLFENTYNGSSVIDQVSSIFGSFGYRFEFTPGVLLRPDVELGVGVLSTNNGNELGLHAKLNLGAGFQFGKSKSFGVLLEPSYQIGGSLGFSVGIFFSAIKYPEKRHLVIE